MATNPPIQIGELLDVPAPGSGVKSPFAQEVAHRIIQRFATVAARTAAWAAPSPAPAKGTPSYLGTGDAVEGPEYWNGVAWRRPWNLPWGRVASATGFAGVTTAGGVESVLMTCPAFVNPGNRYYRITADLTGFGTVNADTFRFGVRQGATIAGAAVKTGPAWQASTFYTPFLIVAVGIPAANAAQQFSLCVMRTAGTGTFSQTNAATYENAIYIDDIGPAGAPA